MCIDGVAALGNRVAITFRLQLLYLGCKLGTFLIQQAQLMAQMFKMLFLIAQAKPPE
jgi:hypothetical protein